MIDALILAAALSAAAPPVPGTCLEPDERTNEGLRLLGHGEPCVRRAPPLRNMGPVPAKLQASIRNKLNVTLFDGFSARYLWPPVRGRAGQYCGWVNAKNRMGAYTGFKLFAVKYDLKSLTADSVIIDDSDDQRVIEITCEVMGYSPKPPGA